MNKKYEVRKMGLKIFVHESKHLIYLDWENNPKWTKLVFMWYTV